MKRLYIPFIWELVLIISTIIWEKQSFYFFFVFYVGLVAYFYFINKQFSFRELRSNFNDVKAFWIPVTVTVAAMLLAYRLQELIIDSLYTEYYDSIVHIPIRNELAPLLFNCLMCMIIKPFAEGLFYRQAIILFDSKKKTVLLTIVSLMLCAVTMAHGPVGISTFVIMALPVTIVYLITKNIYVSVMAHFLFEFYNTGYETVYTLARLYYR